MAPLMYFGKKDILPAVKVTFTKDSRDNKPIEF